MSIQINDLVAQRLDDTICVTSLEKKRYVCYRIQHMVASLCRHRISELNVRPEITIEHAGCKTHTCMQSHP